MKETRVYTVIRSDRRSVALQIKNGELIVRAPRLMSEGQIARFVSDHEAWIEKHLTAARQRPSEPAEVLSPEELRTLMERAKAHIPERVRHYAPLVGVSCGRITIRAQRSRWGSCSEKGNLNFNCLLMLAPAEVLDSVVVHELCHRKEMNHSPRFYAEVYRVFPDYDRAHGWLKENGAALLRRITG